MKIGPVLFLILLCIPLFARSGAHVVDLGDFRLENGQTIRDCIIVYRSFGKLNSDSSNVILYPTWFNGTTAHLASVSTAGKIVDSTKYFVIAVAALGNGESSSPSNSCIQPGRDFPQFNIRDMVHAQYAMLKKEFGFDHIKAVVGGSMGSMQTYEWIVQYPDFMDKGIVYVATPKLTSSDLLWMQLRSKFIRTSPDSSKAVWSMISALTKITARTTEHVTKNTKPEDLDLLWQNWSNAKHEKFSLTDYDFQLQAMQAHDIFQPFGGDPEKTAAAIKADVLQIVSESDLLLNPAPAIDFGTYLKGKTIVLKGNCGHLEPGCQMKRVSKIIREFLKKE